jgi:hypothetical protein
MAKTKDTSRESPYKESASFAAHQARMAAKPVWEPRKGAATEAERHATLLEAVRRGHVWVDPAGQIAVRSGVAGYVNIDGEVVPVLDAPPGYASQMTKLAASIGARVAVYRAVGLPMGKVPHALCLRARELAKQLELVGGSDEAPVEFIRNAEVAVAAVTGENNAAGWQLVLEGILKGPAAGQTALLPKDDTEAAKWLVATLLKSAPDAPALFRELRADKLAGIAAVIVKLRGKRNRGAPKNAWGWAREIAGAVGVTMAKTRSDATRKRES